VSCNSCGPANQEKFESEVSIHFSRLKDINKRPVVVFAELLVCMNCGKAEFILQENQLARLAGAMRLGLLGLIEPYVWNCPRPAGS